jgi:hypothetical protein
MHCIALVQPTQTSPEFAILQMDSKEHESFHKNPTAFVNDNHVFKKQVRKVDVLAHAETTVSYVVLGHPPDCHVYAFCV